MIARNACDRTKSYQSFSYVWEPLRHAVDVQVAHSLKPYVVCPHLLLLGPYWWDAWREACISFSWPVICFFCHRFPTPSEMLIAISAETVKCQVVPIVAWPVGKPREHSSSKHSLLGKSVFLSKEFALENSAFFKEVTGQVSAQRILKEQKEAIYSSWLKWEFIV